MIACSQTGFMVNFEVYTGKKSSNDPEAGLSKIPEAENVVNNQSLPFINSGHCLFYNFFSSVVLVKKLLYDTLTRGRIELNTLKCY